LSPLLNGLDKRTIGDRDSVCRTRLRELIARASELSEDERRIVVDAIAPKESLATLADAWEAEIARRAARVRSGESLAKSADEVFDRLEAKLKAR
jgi:hypothetical protein